MSYEIYETRMIGRSGTRPGMLPFLGYRAVVRGDVFETLAELHLRLERDGDSLGIKGEATVPIKDLTDAIVGLRRLAGIKVPDDPHGELRERAASVVERACHFLQGGSDPVLETVVTDLRTTMLQLIDLATRRDESTEKLESDVGPTAGLDRLRGSGPLA